MLFNVETSSFSAVHDDQISSASTVSVVSDGLECYGQADLVMIDPGSRSPPFEERTVSNTLSSLLIATYVFYSTHCLCG